MMLACNGQIAANRCPVVQSVVSLMKSYAADSLSLKILIYSMAVVFLLKKDGVFAYNTFEILTTS